MADPSTLYLVRHGEIDRPPVAQFEDAVLTERGRKQVHALASHWKHPVPDVVYCSPLPRSVETASIMTASFRRPVRMVKELKEWAATEWNVPQKTYLEWERQCWEDFDHRNHEGESLHQATERITTALTRVAQNHAGRPVMVSGHAILFALFHAKATGGKATEASKNAIPFAAFAIVKYHGTFRFIRDFAP